MRMRVERSLAARSLDRSGKNHVLKKMQDDCDYCSTGADLLSVLPNGEVLRIW